MKDQDPTLAIVLASIPIVLLAVMAVVILLQGCETLRVVPNDDRIGVPGDVR